MADFNLNSLNPFYQSAISMGLEPIPEDTYACFASNLFEQFDKHISVDAIHEVYHQFDGVTWFVQMLMNELFALTESGKTCGIDRVPEALQNAVMSQEMQY